MTLEKGPLLKHLRAQLKSENTSTIMEAVRRCREEGEPELIHDLVRALGNAPVPAVREAIVSLLNDLDGKPAGDVMASILKKSGGHPELQAMVSSCWQSRMDCSTHSDIFIEFLLSGDYMVAIEAFTVLEENQGRTAVADLERAVERLKSEFTSLDAERQILIREMIMVLGG